MKRGLSKEISLLTVMVMLMSLLPMGVSAVDTSAENKAVVKQESPSVNSTETNTINSVLDVNVSENKPITTADPLKPETDRTIQTSETLQTSAVENDFSYEDFGTGVCITEYTGSGGNVVVPSTLGGKQVLKLGDNAFSDFGGIIFTAITLPDDVTTIGNRTFWGDTSLTTINLPDSVTTIGDGAFVACTSLTAITLPDSVTTIGDAVFSQCYSLTTITLSDSLTTISSYAFSGCTSLTAITLPDNVTTIDDHAFKDCGLTTITLPNSVTAIGDGAFLWCTSLTKVVIPSSVTSIGSEVFYDCPNLTIYGNTGSYAETYANEWGIPFIANVLTGITVSTPPDKTAYVVGQSLDLTGMVVTGTYSDGIQVPVTVTAANISGFNSSAPATGQTVTVTVNGKMATFMVNIIDQTIDCRYQTHVQNIGWQGWRSNGDISGTSGLGLRLEGIEIKTGDSGSAGVEYQTQVQNIGWQGWKANGEMSGTSGKSLRLEAIQIRLTGTDPSKYDIYYQVHAENYGWLDWAKNGESAGTEGLALRLEAIKIMLVPKGAAAPGSTERPFVKK